jgi:hypothetical protein
MSITFEEGLLNVGKILLVAAVIAFAVTSFVTTFRGFQSFLPEEAAFIAALGLQLTLTATEIFYAQVKTARARLVSFVTFLLVITLSVTFSYIGLRQIFTEHLAERRDPIYELNEFRSKRDQLQRDAAALRGAAIDYFNDLNLDVSAQADITTKDESTRRLIAENLRRQIRDYEARRLSTVGLRRQLSAAETRAGSLRFEGARLGNQKELLSQQRKQVDAYNPTISNVTDRDWAALAGEFQRLSGVWGAMSEEFKLAHPLPQTPTRSVLRDGRIAEGQDHPTIEALNSISNPQPHEKFSLALAGILDLIPFVAVLMTKGKGKSLGERLADMRRWMKDVKLQVELMDGLFRWGWKVFVAFFFRRAYTNDDPRVVAFRRFLNDLRAELDDFLERAALPGATAELIRLQLTDLYAKSHEIAFEASSKLNESVLRTHAACLDEIKRDGLDEGAKQQLEQFLNRHLDRFDEAVRAASYTDRN